MSEKKYAKCFQLVKNWRSVKLAGALILCGSKPVMVALENSTSSNRSSVESSPDKCDFSNSGNSAESVTKNNVQEFSHVLCYPCEPVIRSESKMFNPQVTVTCQMGVLKKASLKTSIMKKFFFWSY